jgi:hypothetical protein
MQTLINGSPGSRETWEELAEHSLTHDDLGSPIALAGRNGTLRIEINPATHMPRLMDGDAPLPRHPQRGERNEGGSCPATC